MSKTALAGAFALALGLAAVPAAAQTADEAGRIGAAMAQLSESHIAHLKAALNLRPEQRPHWVPVEAALRDLVRDSARGPREPADGGFIQRAGDRAAALAADAMRLRRLAMAARPLYRTLDDDQKRGAMLLARRFGLDRFIAAL